MNIISVNHLIPILIKKTSGCKEIFFFDPTENQIYDNNVENITNTSKEIIEALSIPENEGLSQENFEELFNKTVETMNDPKWKYKE